MFRQIVDRVLSFRRNRSLDAALNRLERERVLEALQQTNWKLSRAAALLGMPRNTLRYRVDRLGLSRDSPIAS